MCHDAFHDTRRLGAVEAGDDTNAGEEARELEGVAVAQVGGVHHGDVLALLLEEFKTDVKHIAGLVHGAGRDVDVDQHAADGGTDGLEVAAPEDDAHANVHGLTWGEERANVEGVVPVNGMDQHDA